MSAAVTASEGGGADAATGTPSEGLPERDRVRWRTRTDEARLRRVGWEWTGWTLVHCLPFLGAAALLVCVKPVLAPISLILVLHAYAIPWLSAGRGAVVLHERRRLGAGPESRALLLLGDLVDDANRQLHAASGLVIQPGELGTWVVGESGALLVRPGGHRVNCYCVRVTGEDLPHGDRIAHLLLALRCDERDFATVANVAFSGARWRVRQRLNARQRVALDAAVRSMGSGRVRRAGIVTGGKSGISTVGGL